MRNNYSVFTGKIVLLVGILIVMDISIGKVLEHYFFRMRVGETARTIYSIREADQDVIILGSSRANHHYVPSIISDSLRMECYNAGIDGQGMLYYYAIQKSILHRAKPKLIILDLRPDEFEKDEMSYNKLSRLLPYYFHNHDIQEVVNLRGPFEKYKAFSNLYRYNSFLLPIVVNNVMNRKESSQAGYIPLQGNLRKPIQTKKRVTLETKTDNVKIHYFRAFIQAAQAADCQLFVFVSPCYSLMNKTSTSALLAQTICQQSNIPFWDFSRDSTFVQSSALFHDEFHLNDRGAKLYTQMLLKEHLLRHDAID